MGHEPLHRLNAGLTIESVSGDSLKYGYRGGSPTAGKGTQVHVPTTDGTRHPPPGGGSGTIPPRTPRTAAYRAHHRPCRESVEVTASA
ncbi:hypothetical protein SAMN04487819_109200 [Actinopolyspora alba]|uniref:Uncharacterized protein n=1 Tax=Actinopolyspora alba TaxID=673379 RepID=A0A1I1YRL2_9ACTN|nr:hypothetical protein SAMN04487819_109200 [Actinopolyspora alba]